MVLQVFRRPLWTLTYEWLRHLTPGTVSKHTAVKYGAGYVVVLEVVSKLMEKNKNLILIRGAARVESFWLVTASAWQWSHDPKHNAAKAYLDTQTHNQSDLNITEAVNRTNNSQHPKKSFERPSKSLENCSWREMTTNEFRLCWRIDLFQLNKLYVRPHVQCSWCCRQSRPLYLRTTLSSLNSAATSFPLRCQCTPGSAIGHPTL